MKKLRTSAEVASRRVERGELAQLRKGVIDLASPPVRAVTLGRQVAAANKWRDGLNPQRNLTMARAVSMIESAMRGQWTELQWTFGAPVSGLESVDADTIALIELRSAALLDMEWDVEILKDARDKTLAEEQRAFLTAAYNRIDNLYEAIEHMELASFRKFAFAELVDGAGEASLLNAQRVRCLDGWNFVRDGSAGDWFWNPEAKITTAAALGKDSRIVFPERALLFREVPRPIHRYGLPKLIRSNLSEKDWDALIEIFGIERPIVIGPDNVPSEKEAAYEAAAESVANGAGGYLPFGSQVEYPNAQKSGISPFEARLRYLSTKHILVGTGGMLTMLSDATGIGAGASGAHQETFRKIAAGSARRISEVFNRQFDRRLLALAFPGQPALAYWKLDAREQKDLADIADTTLKFFQAGWSRDAAELAEETGIKLVPAPAPAAGTVPALGFRSARRAPAAAQASPEDARSGLVAQAVAQTLETQAEWLAPFFQSLEAKAAAGEMTEDEFLAALDQAAASMPELFQAADPEAMAKPMLDLLGTSLVNAIDAKKGGAK